jgi:single-strand DNA-binding protein
VKDPELSYTPKGTAVCKFTVACNRAFKQDDQLQKEVSFFDVSTWTRLAEVCGEYLKKGRGVRVVGRLKQDRWTDPDGKPHSRIIVIAEHVEFKPQFKNKDSADGKTEEEKPEETGAEPAEQDEEEVKEASSF